MLWYNTCAESPLEALPLGNGKLGALLFGGVNDELVMLNEDTLWSGYPKDTLNREARAHLDRVRDMIFAGHNREAQDLIEKGMQGCWTQSYMPMANLRLHGAHDTQEGMEGLDYRRSLDLETATARVTYSVDGVRYTRTGFLSAPDGVLVLRMEADKAGRLDLTVSLDSQLLYETQIRDGDIRLFGRCPDAAAPNYVLDEADPVVYDTPGRGMRFEVRVRVLPEGGSLRRTEEGLRLEGADACLLLLTAANSFDTPAYAERVRTVLDKAAVRPYAQLLRRHQEDFAAQFRRVEFYLGEAPALSTAERIRQAQEGKPDAALAADYYQFGRYLLLSSCRDGQPANLQGIWSWEVRPPWSANWTTNINTPMNYWAAEPTNLSACHQTLFSWLAGLVSSGTRTARTHYGARGYCIHHNVDLWAMTTPANGNAVWAFWPMAGVWFCHHLYEHYQYTNDRDFLRETAVPLMRGSVLFCLDWLIPDGQGRYVTNPSTSPECSFFDENGAVTGVSCASAMDMTLIRELFGNYLEACDVLGLEDVLCADIRDRLKNLIPYTIREDGRLCEWSREHTEAEPGHRHLSHLYGIYPGSLFFEDSTLYEAAEKAFRGRLVEENGYVGWSLVWRLAIAARFRDKELAQSLLDDLLGKVTAPNLFDIYRPGGVKTVIEDAHTAVSREEPSWFQIDANLGAPGAMTELLLQCHRGWVEFLPCLPVSWSTGYIRGLRARGDVEIDLYWQDGRLTEAHVRAGGRFDEEKPLQLVYNGSTCMLPCKRGEHYRIRYIEKAKD